MVKTPGIMIMSGVLHFMALFLLSYELGAMHAAYFSSF
jgi:hypothetical protein